MLFWQNFFKNSILRDDEHSKQNNNHEELIILKQVAYNNNEIDVYFSTNKNINLYHLEQLCDEVGWVRRPLKKIQTAIENSFLIVSLFYKQNNKEQLIGFARVTSDHAFNATVWDVAIRPSFQGQGLGKILIHQVIHQLRESEITTITLFADPQVVNFYSHLGFLTDPSGVKGMFWYPK
uniref:GCN5-like N-acetyltransferase n=1 Tax=Rhodella violacea TaxID=2801 RepID=UPI001FCE15A5|nr:GCN5-like N-acetyltransferase [Rhodella violacea]UNJ18091.1 GCN5-like N-acetyltransferase [Rhodella violacea]